MSRVKIRDRFFKLLNWPRLTLLLGLLISGLAHNSSWSQSANTALINAIIDNDRQTAETSIWSVGSVNVTDSNHMTPLMYAVQSTTCYGPNGPGSAQEWNALTYVTDLLNPKAPAGSIGDPTAANQVTGQTVLMYAVASANECVDAIKSSQQMLLMEIIQTLLTQLNSTGAGLLIDINAKDHAGKTALDYAAASTNSLAPRIVMTLLLTPGIEIPASFPLTAIQKNTRQLWADLITPSTNFLTTPNVINPNFDLATVQNDLNAPGGVDLNAQDNWGNTILIYIAQALAGTVKDYTLSADQTQNLTDLLNSTILSSANTPNIDFNLANLPQPAGLNASFSKKTSFTYTTGLTAGGAGSGFTTLAGYLTTNTTLNTAMSTQASNITSLFNLINGTTPPQNGETAYSGVNSTNVNWRDPNSKHFTPLIYAAQANTPNSADLQASLSQSNVAINAQDDNGTTALMWLAQNSNDTSTLIQTLGQQTSLNLNMRDNAGNTALIWALQNPGGVNANVVNAILALPNLDLTLTDNSGMSALDWATQNFQAISVATVLSALRAQLINAIDQGNLSAITKIKQLIQNCAADTNSNSCAATFKGLTIDLADSNGVTPLMYATKSLNSAINTGITPNLPIALEIVQILVQAGADVLATDNNGLTPLMYAAQSLNSMIDTKQSMPVVGEILQYLQQSGANPATVDKQGHTALSYAQNTANANQAAIVQTLKTLANQQLYADLQSNATATIATIQADLAAGANLGAADPTKNNLTPLMYAAQNTTNTAIDKTVTPNQPVLVEIINFILAQAPNTLLAEDSNGYMAYHYALQSTNPNQTAILTALSAAATAQLFTILQNPQCTVEMVGQALAAGANAIAIDSQNHNPLYYANALPYSNTAKNIIIQLITSKIVQSATNQLFSDLHNPNITLAAIQADLTAGANITATSLGYTPLYYAQQLPKTNPDRAAIVQAVATAQLYNDLQSTSTLPTAAIITADITAGANVAIPAKSGKFALSYAQLLPAQNTDKAAIIQAIINAATKQLFADLQSANNASLTLATIQADLAAGANVNSADSNNKTPLMYANALPSTNNNKAAIIQALTAAQASTITQQLFTDLQNVNVTLAAIQADLTGGANVNAVDASNNNLTPLMYALQSQNSATDTSVVPNLPVALEIVQALIGAMQKTGSNNSIYAQDTNQHNALYYAQNLATSANQAAMTQAVATAQLFYDLQNSAVTVATIQADITAGANVVAVDANQKTTFDYANVLPVSSKASIIAALTYAITPQLLADLQSANSTLAQIQADVAAGADLNYIDSKNNNMTPLMYAAQSPNSWIDPVSKQPIIVQIINYILNNKALTIASGVFAVDSNKKTAYNYAQQSSNPQRPAILATLSAIATPQLITDLQNNNITLAAINLDISAGANVNATTTFGGIGNVTPLMLAAQSQNSALDNTVIPSVPVIVEIIQVLLGAGANSAAVDSSNHNANYYAQNNWNNPYQQAIINAISGQGSLTSTPKKTLNALPAKTATAPATTPVAPAKPTKPARKPAKRGRSARRAPKPVVTAPKPAGGK